MCLGFPLNPRGGAVAALYRGAYVTITELTTGTNADCFSVEMFYFAHPAMTLALGIA